MGIGFPKLSGRDAVLAAGCWGGGVVLAARLLGRRVGSEGIAEAADWFGDGEVRWSGASGARLFGAGGRAGVERSASSRRIAFGARIVSGGRGVRRRTRLVFLRKDPGDARYACPNDSRVAHAILPLCLDGDALIGNVGGGDCPGLCFAGLCPSANGSVEPVDVTRLLASKTSGC